MKRWGGIFTISTVGGLAAVGALFTAGMYTFNMSKHSVQFAYAPASTIEAREVPRHVPPPEDGVHALYMTSWVAGTSDWRNDIVDFVDQNPRLNALVIDVKDYTGEVAWKERVKDMPNFIEYLHQHGIYAIARITVFQDPLYAKAHPEDAIKHTNGRLWSDKNGLHYVDPKAHAFWDYIVDIAKESERMGFDELNFDYIRFPSDGPVMQARFPYWDQERESRVEALDEFFSYLRAQLREVAVPISADVFGLTTWQEDDLNIGQMLENIALYFDYVAPMVYPSHYPPTFQGFKNPAAHPYEIVYTAMERGVFRIEQMGGNPKRLRPWLQDFDLGATYDAPMIQKQIKAVEDAGLDSWMMWDPSNKYTRSAY
ncbi:MAG: putative glycoside hydrolase [Patescibacteria group bacterium]